MRVSVTPASGDTVLGLDFGLSRIGVAVGSLLTGNAQPLGSVPNGRSGPDWRTLKRYIDEWQPGRFIVGLPRSLDGTENEMSDAARRFAGDISRRFRIPVELVDEQLSSAEARDYLRESRRSGRRRRRVRKTDVDPVAARVILETWLNEGHHPDPAAGGSAN